MNPSSTITPQALAAKGTAARPDLANRMTKAARLVESGLVDLTGPETAVVTSGHHEYEVDGRSCTCEFQRHRPGQWCSHLLAVRMARAIAAAVTGNVTSEPDPADVGAPTPPLQSETAPILHSYKLLHPAGGQPYILAIWRQPGRGMFPVQYDAGGRLLPQPAWYSQEKPPALPDGIVEQLRETAVSGDAPALSRRLENKLETERRVNEASQRDRAAYRRWYDSSEGKRAYIMTAAANGAATFDPAKFAKATGRGHEAELAAAKEQALRELGLR